MIRGISVIILLLTTVPSHAQSGEITSICSSKEVVYFSCVADEDILSLCGSTEGSKLKGLQLRVGKAGKTRFIYPNSMENSLQAFKFSRYTRPLVTYLRLLFELDSVKYELYSDSSYEENMKEEDWSAGLTKVMGDSFVDLAVCTEHPYDRISDLENILKKE